MGKVRKISQTHSFMDTNIGVSSVKLWVCYSFLKFYLYNPSLDSRCSKLATPSVTIAITVAACS